MGVELKKEIVAAVKRGLGLAELGTERVQAGELEDLDAIISKGLQKACEALQEPWEDSMSEDEQSCPVGAILGFHTVKVEGRRIKAFPARRRSTATKEDHKTVAAALEEVESLPCDLTYCPEVRAAVSGGEISPALLEEWRRHLLADHMPFRRDCAACVQASATGHQHKRVKHATPCVLSLDIAGPFRVKGEAVDTGGGGTWEPKARYLLVGSYRAPAVAFRDNVSENPELPPDLDVPDIEEDPWF